MVLKPTVQQNYALKASDNFNSLRNLVMRENEEIDYPYWSSAFIIFFNLSSTKALLEKRRFLFISIVSSLSNPYFLEKPKDIHIRLKNIFLDFFVKQFIHYVLFDSQIKWPLYCQFQMK